MKKLLIIRKETGPQGTFGTAMTIPGDYAWVSGELPWTDLDKDGRRDTSVSCIAPGTFRAKERLSPTRGILVYELQDTPDAVNVQIHRGNYCGSKKDGFRSDVLGCILLGKEQGEMNGQKAVAISGAAITEFMAWANGEEIEVQIEEQFPGIGEIKRG